MKALAAAAVLLLFVPDVGAVSELLVFQGNPASSGFGYDVDQGPYSESCPGPYGSEKCQTYSTSSFEHDYLGVALDGDKHAYRVPFMINAAEDGGTTLFTATFSFLTGGITSQSHGDGKSSGAYGQSVSVQLKETHGWDLVVSEVTDGKYAQLAAGSDGRDSNAWHEYTLSVNTDTGDVHVLDDLDTILVSAHLTHHAGFAIHSQWFQSHGNEWWVAAIAHVRMNGDSTAIYDQDPRPPVISNLTQNPQLVAPTQSVLVSATIRDDWGTATAVVKRWHNGVAAPDVAMHATGTTYTATLPGEEKGVVVRYQVQATATSGLKATSDTIQYTVGSSQGPSNLGGGAGAVLASSKMDAALAFIVVLGLALFLYVILRRQYPARAPLVVLASVPIGVAVAFYVLQPAAVTKFLLNPFVPIIVIGALALVPFLRRRPAGGAP